MRLNAVERFLMNNPVRAAIQRRVEAHHFERMGGRLEGQRVLEIGCGQGVGVEILIDRFGAWPVHAFDVDANMVARTRRRLAGRYSADRVSLFVGDAVRIPLATAAYDAVVDFGAIHHVPDWRGAVAEIRRILRPGGRFYFLEVSRRFLNRRLTRTFLDHPREDRFDEAEFVCVLERHSIDVSGRLTRRLGGDVFAGVGILS